MTRHNRRRERHGLSGRHAREERRAKVDGLVDQVLAERGTNRTDCGLTALLAAEGFAEAHLLQRVGFDTAEQYGPKSPSGQSGLRAWGQSTDRKQRWLAVLNVHAPLAAPERPEEGRLRFIVRTVVGSDGRVVYALQPTAPPTQLDLLGAA